MTSEGSEMETLARTTLAKEKMQKVNISTTAGRFKALIGTWGTPGGGSYDTLGVSARIYTFLFTLVVEISHLPRDYVEVGHMRIGSTGIWKLVESSSGEIISWFQAAESQAHKLTTQEVLATISRSSFVC